MPSERVASRFDTTVAKLRNRFASTTNEIFQSLLHDAWNQYASREIVQRTYAPDALASDDRSEIERRLRGLESPFAELVAFARQHPTKIGPKVAPRHLTPEEWAQETALAAAGDALPFEGSASRLSEWRMALLNAAVEGDTPGSRILAAWKQIRSWDEGPSSGDNKQDDTKSEVKVPAHYVGVYTFAASKLLERFKHDFTAKVRLLGSTVAISYPSPKRNRHRAEAEGRNRLPANKSVLTVAEAQDKLRLSRSSIYRFLNEGKLTRASLGRKAGMRGKALIKSESVEKLLSEDSE